MAEVHAGSSSIMLCLVREQFDDTAFVGIYLSIMFLIHLKCLYVIQDDTKNRELLKTPTKIEEIQEKKIIDRN